MRGFRIAIRLQSMATPSNLAPSPDRSALHTRIHAIPPFCRRARPGTGHRAIHRHFVALQYRAESLPHVAVMTRWPQPRIFWQAGCRRFTELVPHALEDDWDVDESVDEVNEERAEVWAALDRGLGSGHHGRRR